MPPLSDVLPAAAPSPPARLRRGNPNGNPTLNLSPRCGARTRAGCPCRAPAVHGGLRCRMHGGRSTGARTAEGLARARAARTRHGGCAAGARTMHRHDVSALRRARVLEAAARYLPLLPPDLAARLFQFPPELQPLPRPLRLLTVAEDRALMLAEAAALAPWRTAIAAAREVRRAEWRVRMGREAPPAPVLAAMGMCGPVIPGEAPHAPVLMDGPLTLLDPLRGSRPPEGGGDAVAPAVRAQTAAKVISVEAPHAPVFADDPVTLLDPLRGASPRDGGANAGTPVAAAVIPGEAPHTPMSKGMEKGARVILEQAPRAPVLLDGPLSHLDPLRGSSPREGGGDAVAPPVPARAAAVNPPEAPHAPVKDAVAGAAMPPGLTRKERRHWKWLQRQALRRSDPAAPSAAGP